MIIICLSLLVLTHGFKPILFNGNSKMSIKTSNHIKMISKCKSATTYSSFLNTKLKMCKSNDDTNTDIDAISENTEKNLVLGLDLTDPQDWLTIVLGSIIVFNAVDLAWYYGGGLIGKIVGAY